MKKTYRWLVALIVLPLLIMTIPSQKANAQDVAVSYQTFYDEMAPYGQWVNDPQYGNVWVPNVAPGFRPYATDGHWVMTENGNMWVSDVPWAWAAYHYGRWTYNGYYGWVWIPGYEWAPAWVNWRSGGGYYGWAPLGPGQMYGGVYDYPANYWVFVNPNYLYHPNVYTYYERGDMNVYVHQTSYVTYEHGGHYYGPRREVIERETHHPVEVYRVSGAREAGESHMGGHEVSIYRPAVNRESEHSARPANVVEGRDHPVGRPEPISESHAHEQPAFRTEHTQQQQQQRQQQVQQQQQRQPQPPQHQQQQTQQQRPQPQQQQQQQQHQQQQNQQQRPPQQQQQQQHQQQQTQQQRPQPQQQPQHQQQPQQQQRPAQQQAPRPQPQPQPRQQEKHK